MYHFRDTSSQSVLKNFSYCLFYSVYFQLLFINQCPLIFIVYPPMFLFFLLFVHNCLFLFWLLTNVFSFCLFFIHQSLLFIVIVYPPMSLLVLVVHQCLHLRFIVYSPMSPSWCCLSTIVSFGFGCSPISSSFIIVYPPAQCLLLVLWIHQCLLVLVVHLCLPFVIVCPQMYPFSNSLSTMSTFGKC